MLGPNPERPTVQQLQQAGSEQRCSTQQPRQPSARRPLRPPAEHPYTVLRFRTIAIQSTVSSPKPTGGTADTSILHLSYRISLCRDFTGIIRKNFFQRLHQVFLRNGSLNILVFVDGRKRDFAFFVSPFATTTAA